MEETINFKELAKKQFYALKEEILDEDRKSLGAGNEQDYTINDKKFTIIVDGFWEKAIWFEYFVLDENGNKIESGAVS